MSAEREGRVAYSRPMRLRSLLLSRLGVTFGLFIMLGLPEGVLGTAWPNMRLDFGRPESALAQLTIGYTLGYFISTVGTGRISARVGLDRTTRVGIAVTAAGLVGYLVAPGWSLALLSSLVLGLGGGTVDASVNADVALRYGPRVMHLLHAMFGIGATVGPLLVRFLAGTDLSWRAAYAALLVFEVLLLAGHIAFRRRELASVKPEESGAEPTPITELVARPQLVLVLMLVYFGFYVGSELALGAWAYSILTEGRGVAEDTAGYMVAAYWGGLTAGRLLFSALDERVYPLHLLRGAVGAALAAIVWFWADTAGSMLALPLAGLAFAGVFPALVLLTPGWLGRDRVAQVVGFQLAASSVGAIASQALLGTVAAWQGLNALPAVFVIYVAFLAATHFATEAAVR